MSDHVHARACVQRSTAMTSAAGRPPIRGRPRIMAGRWPLCVPVLYVCVRVCIFASSCFFVCLFVCFTAGHWPAGTWPQHMQERGARRATFCAIFHLVCNAITNAISVLYSVAILYNSTFAISFLDLYCDTFDYIYTIPVVVRLMILEVILVDIVCDTVQCP